MPSLSDAKHIGVGLLALVLFPVWFPLLIVGMFIDLLRRIGADTCDWLERK